MILSQKGGFYSVLCAFRGFELFRFLFFDVAFLRPSAVIISSSNHIEAGKKIIKNAMAIHFAKLK